MTPEAKRALSATIRKLRARLLDDLHAASDTAYRFAVKPIKDAGLDEAAAAKRARLDAWIAEQLRAQAAEGVKAKDARSDDDFRRDIEKQAASTLLNRLVLLRLMEAPGSAGKPLRAPAVVTGGWDSRGYKDFRQLAPDLVRGDDTEGYAFLLKLVFEDLAKDLPGLYGSMGLADLIPIPAAALRFAVDSLNEPELESCWTDDMTLGWVYQYWNDPEREHLDDKLNPATSWGSGKIEHHEIASKTQMFTERYMVDWLLQNSLGPMWLAMCKKHGWAAEAESTGVLQALEERRIDWRKKRDAGEVSLTDLMPLHSELEQRWAYYVPQPIPEDAVEKAPESLRALKLLDPAVGSGHFLVIALTLLFGLYQEEARHRGVANAAEWSDRAIVEHILSHNLHGIDLDPRAVQIAGAALWLKAQQLARGARPARLNLVASNLKLASLRDDDPSLEALRRAVEQETGIPGKLTDTIIHALRGADHLGSLLKVDKAVEDAIDAHERASLEPPPPAQRSLFGDPPAPAKAALPFDAAKARRSLPELLEEFLAHDSAGDDLGLRLAGEQLAAGVRFVRMIHPGTYDLVVANPPYQGTAKMADSKYVEKNYELGKADLYAAFLLRGLELARAGGVSAMLTMRNWMFIKQFSPLREHLLKEHGLEALGDFDRGAFEDVPDEVVSVAVSAFRRSAPALQSIATCPTRRDDRSRDSARTPRKRAATLCQVGRHEFDPAALKLVPEWPLVYWWTTEFLVLYAEAPKLGAVAPVRLGVRTSDNIRFLRVPWETEAVAWSHYLTSRKPPSHDEWVPYVKGAEGREWIEPLNCVFLWTRSGLEVKTKLEFAYGMSTQSPEFFFIPGVAFSMIGAGFRARAHRYRSIIGDKGSSAFPNDIPKTLAVMNSLVSRNVVESLNPSVSFQVGDVSRIPLFPIAGADAILAQIESAFTLHESHREPSVEFKRPGPSPWRHAQEWAQLAVDRPEGAPLPEYVEQLDPEPASDHVSFALGVALGRFGKNGEGILDAQKADLAHALPAGILFLDTTLDATDDRDSLGHPSSKPLHAAWKTYGASIDPKRSLREYLAWDFFKYVHKAMYETRPIHWPLSSSKRTFVAWVNIHRMNEQTLRVLLADHLMPTLARLDGELNDLRTARDGQDKKNARTAEKRLDQVSKARDELQEFIANVEQCADRGAPPAEPKSTPREQDARYAPDLDDGVMINSAALWPLLEPQWKDPKKWWKELSEASSTDYDWSHLAMRYWPKRVDEKCQKEPSHGVAHGGFWRYHPERAWAWELRLQDEIGPDFRIEEKPYRPGGKDVGDTGDAPHRAAWLREHPAEALAAIEKEATRRMGRNKTRKIVERFALLESGLWSTCFEELWAMELRLSQKQGAELCITAPDEAKGRKAYIAAHPKAQKERELLMKELVPQTEMFNEDEEDSEAEPDADAEAEEDDS